MPGLTRARSRRKTPAGGCDVSRRAPAGAAQSACPPYRRHIRFRTEAGGDPLPPAVPGGHRRGNGSSAPQSGRPGGRAKRSQTGGPSQRLARRGTHVSPLGPRMRSASTNGRGPAHGSASCTVGLRRLPVIAESGEPLASRGEPQRIPGRHHRPASRPAQVRCPPKSPASRSGSKSSPRSVNNRRASRRKGSIADLPSPWRCRHHQSALHSLPSCHQAGTTRRRSPSSATAGCWPTTVRLPRRSWSTRMNRIESEVCPPSEPELHPSRISEPISSGLASSVRRSSSGVQRPARSDLRMVFAARSSPSWANA